MNQIWSSMAHTMKDLLVSAVKRQGIGKDLATLHAIQAANAYLSTRLPGERRGDAEAISVRGGILTIACLHAAVSQMFTREAPHIVHAVYQAAPEAQVSRVKTKIVENLPSFEANY